MNWSTTPWVEAVPHLKPVLLSQLRLTTLQNLIYVEIATPESPQRLILLISEPGLAGAKQEQIELKGGKVA